MANIEKVDQDPIRIYVLWHPKCKDGEILAKSLFEWFEKVDDGVGIPVRYRSSPCVDHDCGIPAPIPFKEFDNTAVVILADENMVADEKWSRWLEDMAEGRKTNGKKLLKHFMFYPVALHDSAYNLPPAIRKLNFISLQKSSGRGTKLAEATLDEKKEVLRKKLTEAFARAVLYLGAGRSKNDLGVADVTPPPVKIFLSHAKRDGRDQAASVRDYIYAETQLNAFYDENDIAIGHNFANVLDDALEKGQTAALLSLVTDAYAGRPWCRREIQDFRRPSQPNKKEPVWKLHPVLVVNGMEDNLTRCIPEYGNALTIRWQEGKQGLYVDTLLREVLFRNTIIG